MASLAKFGALCDDLLDSVVVLLDRFVNPICMVTNEFWLLGAYWIMIMK